MEAAFCIEALEEALARYDKPDIFNTDQGSQFTSMDFTAVLNKAEIAISMDGKGAWRDNVFIERLWRSIKYEEVYLHAYKTVSEARVGIGRYLTFYNTRRPHSSLDRQTPDQALLQRAGTNDGGGIIEAATTNHHRLFTTGVITLPSSSANPVPCAMVPPSWNYRRPSANCRTRCFAAPVVIVRWLISLLSSFITQRTGRPSRR